MIGALLTRMMVRRGCAYLNSREIDKFLKQWREDAVFVYPGETRASGEHCGKNRIREWWLAFYGQFPSSHFATRRIYIKDITAITASNQIALEWAVQVTNQLGESFKNHGVSLVDIHNGKISRFEDFIFDLKTLERAWASNEAL